jgi:hydroxymethylbilane synthase
MIGTRGSLLARTQSTWVKNILAKAYPQHVFELVIIQTTGDKDTSKPLRAFGGTGVFIKELEEALREGLIDMAVHSLKDVPGDLTLGLELAGFYTREDPRDVLISAYKNLSDLPLGATVGTGSLRRRVQLRKSRPDLKFVEVRGNLDTRLALVQNGNIEALILAAAGMHRLGWHEHIACYLPVSQMIPAPAQGIVAAEIRSGDLWLKTLLQEVSCPHATLSARAERLFMQAVGGGCKVPMAAYFEPTAQAGEHAKCAKFYAMLADPVASTMYSLCKSYDPKQEDLESFITKFAAEMEVSCRQLSIPFPKDLPPHELLKHEL